MIKIKPSSKNTNKHTEDGMQLLKTSIEKVGVLESISVTKEGTIISGHARSEVFNSKGMVAKEIHLKENEYPVIITDIQDNTKEYFEAQILANTTANKNFNLDNELIEEIAVEYDIDIEELGISEIITLEQIEKQNFKDKDFEKEINKITNENCEYPIVPQFMEKQECFIIPVSNEIDENFIRNVFGLNGNFKSIDGKVRKSNVIKLEDVRKVIHNDSN